ncbi:tyrosine-type recombinase/integrase [Acidovorax kalamii]|uniref:Integrase n=1 Tax=Acidovorax kalamii TaxID=2004485 RepID=A0A235EH58_9BURK|nr:site-specific integrase [Acidovorax kalamii]OYD48382.1 integrase [Acidovorax kalamii]
MPKRILEKTSLEVSRLRSDGSYAVGGVSGLYLKIEGGSRAWVLRYVHDGHRRRMGLGSYPLVGLAEAREAARNALKLRLGGVDPLQARQAQRQAARLAMARQVRFDDAAEAFISEHESTWRSTLATYAFPHIGHLQVADIGQAHVLQVLAPIWKTKTETASRLRGRIEQVLDWATAHGHRTGPNPARWRSQLEHILADPNNLAPLKHHAAVPVAMLPGTYQRLLTMDGQSARALCFLILTAARSGEVRGMVWSEVDLEAGLWTVPAERMKSHREHRVPLSREVLELLRAQPRIPSVEHVFPSNRKGPLSDTALTALMRRHGLAAVPHGFRSTFRDWAGEMTHHARDAVELCLAHAIDTRTEAAYRRGDMLEKRVAIMQDWAEYVASACRLQAEVAP